jgi:hypothetical protein
MPHGREAITQFTGRRIAVSGSTAFHRNSARLSYPHLKDERILSRASPFASMAFSGAWVRRRRNLSLPFLANWAKVTLYLDNQGLPSLVGRSLTLQGTIANETLSPK